MKKVSVSARSFTKTGLVLFTFSDGTMCTLAPAQISTMLLIGEKIPNVGDEVTTKESVDIHGVVSEQWVQLA